MHSLFFRIVAVCLAMGFWQPWDQRQKQKGLEPVTSPNLIVQTPESHLQLRSATV